MRLIPWTTLSLAVVGEDLFTAVVSRGPLRARSWKGPVLRGFLSMSADESRRALSSLLTSAGADSSARVLLTVPTSWCAVRPVPVDAKGWPGAREGLMASIEQLAPVSASDAMAGLVSRRAAAGQSGDSDAGDGAAASSGWLVVARRSQVGAWTQALARALGREVSAVIAAPMAATGLGLQNTDRAEVLDELAGGVSVRHVLSGGEIDELAGTFGFGDGPAPGAVRLPGIAAEAGPGSSALSGHDLAIGAALAEDIGAGQFVPLEGSARRPARRWVLPAAACLAAAGLALGAARVSESRYERAIRELASQRDAVAEPLREIELVRARAARLSGLVERGVNPLVSQWTPALPALASAQSAVTGDGFIYWVRWNAGGGAGGAASVEMRGEVKQASSVLQSLESAGSLFSGARLVDPVSPVPQRGLETFTVRAERKPSAPAPSSQERGAP